MAKKRKRTRPRRARLQGLRKAVDEGANTAEDIHKRIANLPFEVLGETGPLENTVKRARKLSDRSIHAVYELVRDINHQVVQLANDVLPPPRRRRAVAKGKKSAAKASSKGSRSAAA